MQDKQGVPLRISSVSSLFSVVNLLERHSVIGEQSVLTAAVVGDCIAKR